MQTAAVNPSTAQTNAALVAAVSGKSVRIHGIYASSDTATTITISDGTTHSVIWRQYVGAAGGAFLQVSNELFGMFQSIQGEGLDYSTADTANVYLKVAYEVI